MLLQNRKAFLRTLGLMGTGAMLINSTVIPSAPVAETLANTEPSPSQSGIPLRVAHLTDIHVSPARIAEYGMAASLNAVNSLKDKPTFIMNGGDAIMNAATLTKGGVQEQWNSYHKILQSDNNIPVYNCIGNHDLFGFLMPDNDHAESKKWAMDEYHMPKPYYSFTQGVWKFIVLDSIHGRKSIPGYYGRLDDEQMDWLKSELHSTPEATHVCIVSHIPILAICCMFDRDITNMRSMHISDSNMHADSEELTELFYQHKNVKACLSGHIHMIDYVNYLGVEYFCNGAVAGNWWKGNLKHFAPSYSVMNFYDTGAVSREVHYYKWSA
jgi:3',5'-cyclic AMP phosphodiesterase CpdA